jgi:HSP20 family protein
MTIVRWRPFTEPGPLEGAMRRLFEDFGLAPGLSPAADAYETDSEYVVELELPGYKKTELAVDVTDHALVIKGEPEKATEERTREFTLHERLPHAFERRFLLPTPADTDHVKAVFANGLLEVHTPKLPEVRPKTIAITTK